LATLAGFTLPLSLNGAESTAAPANYTSASLALHDEPAQPPTATPPQASSTTNDPLAQWTMVSSGESDGYTTVRWINKQFVALGAKAIMTSPDGVTWRNTAGNLTGSYYDMASNPSASTFVAIGNNGTIVTSTDMKKWAPQSSPITVRLFSVFWYNGQFLALGDNGTILISPDGARWSSLVSNVGETFHHGTVLGNSLLMASYEGISTSTDGQTWRYMLRTSNRMMDIATNGKLAVAVGGTPDNFRITTDGVQWVRSSVSTVEQLNAVTWTGNQFIAAGDNSTILNSPDGMTWTLRTLGGNYGIEGLAAHDNIFVAVTNGGLIFTNQKVAAVARPEISFAPGPAGSMPRLELKCATPNAKIYYTEDGKDPLSGSIPYTGPFSPAQSETIRVRAYQDGMAPSAVASADFIVNSPTGSK